MFNVAHPKMSKNYRLMPLTTIDAYAESMGYKRVFITKAKAFGRYLARYRPINAPDRYEGIELVVTNSTDGTRALRVWLGYFRGACENGMIFGESLFSSGRMVHIGAGFNSHVDQAFAHIKPLIPNAEAMVERAKTHLLTTERVNELILTALRIREPLLQPSDVIKGLEPRRQADKGNDAWTVLNRAQELLLRGGYTINDSKTKKAIKSPVKTLEYNTKVMDLFMGVL